MKNNNGWIYLYKKMVDWTWYSDTNTKSLFIDLLINASYTDKNWRGIPIKRGQVVIGRRELSERLGITEQSIRTSIKRLKSTNEITIKSTNKFSIITVVNYNKYQSPETKSTNKLTSKLTNNQPATNQQLTTSNKYNKDNKYNNIKDIDEKELLEISEKYQVPISFVKSKLDDLINWHEKNPQKNKYKNYFSALKEWVKKDSLSIKQKQYERNSKIAIINTTD